MDIAVFGLGKLGLAWAAVLADAGFKVIGVDVNKTRVDDINDRARCTSEPYLFDMLFLQPIERFVATLDSHLAVCKTDACFIYVPTPSQADGTFSNHLVLQVCRTIGKTLRRRRGNYSVVVSSTVTPGSMAGPILSTLEEASGKKCGDGFELLYHPEFVALGKVISGMQRPWGLLVGAQEKKHAEFLEAIYCHVMRRPASEQNMRVLSWTEAELTKLFVNVFLTVKPVYANVIADYCERMGADADKVTGFLGLDPRIGSRFLRPGPHPGGPCLPRDVRCAIAVGKQLCAAHGFLNVIAMYEKIQTTQVIQRIKEAEPKCVGILGMAYKLGSSVTTDSFGQRIARALHKEHIPFMVHEVPGIAVGGFEKDAWVQQSLKDIEEKCDVLVVALPREEFKEIDFGVFKFVIDLWRFCDPALIGEGQLYQLGRGVV